MIARTSFQDDVGAFAPLSHRYLAIRSRRQIIGIPVASVQTVFNVDNLTPVPLAPPEVAGLTNLRGRVVTVLNLSRCLGQEELSQPFRQAVGVAHHGVDYALLVEATEDVFVADEAHRIARPPHLDAFLREVICGCYRRGGGYMSILDVEALLRRVTKRSEATARMTGATPKREEHKHEASSCCR